MQKLRIKIKKFVKKLVFFCLLSVLVGCAYNQKNLRLSPYLYKTNSNIGKDHLLAVYVTDDRIKQYLGIHWFGYGKANKINLDNELGPMTRHMLEKGFAAQGFKIASVGQATNRIINVQIQQLEFEQHLAFMATVAMVHASFALTVQNGPDKYYRVFKADEVQNIPPTIESVEEFKQINRVYSSILNQILADPQLLLALTAKKNLIEE